MDMKLEHDIPLDDLPARLNETLPSGLQVVGVKQVDEREPALQTQVESAEYEVTLKAADRFELERRLESVLQAPTIPRERRGKPYDLRPLIEELSLTPTPLPEGEGQGMRVFMRLRAREGATGRPEEVLDVLGIAFEETRIERTRLVFKDMS
jgi:radical SAM-linked protein